MVRRARKVITGVPHHITQRGNNKADVFHDNEDRRKYLEILDSACRQFGLKIHGYCLMSNHVHIIAEPEGEKSLSLGIGRTNLRYSIVMNKKTGQSGRLWHNRFFSCPLDDAHYLAAMRYIERNPVRANIVQKAWHWPWSSAAVHSGWVSQIPPLLTYGHWQNLGISPQDWRKELTAEEDKEIISALRHATSAGWPLGNEEFINKIEAATGVVIRPLPVGRPKTDRQ